MGLFDDLPPPSKESKKPGSPPGPATAISSVEPASKRSRSNEPGVTTGGSLHSALKGKREESNGSKGITEGDQNVKKGPRGVSFKTTEEMSTEQVLAALEKITTHIGTPSKFSKASKLALQLLEAGSVHPSTADHFFEVLKAAMSTPVAAVMPDMHSDYRALFVAAHERSKIFSVAQQEQLRVWLLWADVANELQTDDSYQFSRATGRIRQTIEALPEASLEDENHDSLIVHAEAGCGNVSQPQKEEEGTPACGSKHTGEKAGDADPFGLDSLESDPFGLSALLPKNSKKEERARKKRADEAEQQRVTEERLRLLRERREALIFCLKRAADHYRQTWAQTTIDILVKHAYDFRARFTNSQKKAIESLWDSVRSQQARRKQGKSTQGKLDVTAFERLQDQYANELISVRKGVGSSGGRSTTTWLG